MNINYPTLKWAYSMDVRKTTQRIILHHAAATTCSIEDIHRWHLANGWAGCGYHYLIRKDGSVYGGRPINAVGAHAYSNNGDSIGICFEGDFTKEDPTVALLRSGVQLVRELLAEYVLTPACVIRHSDVNATVCPGDRFPYDQFIRDLDEEPLSHLICRFQQALLDDGFSLPKYGADGLWGKETEKAASKCIVKWRRHYLNIHTTMIAQELLGIEVDGLAGPKTDAAIRTFQKENGLVVDGAIGINTWKALIFDE